MTRGRRQWMVVSVLVLVALGGIGATQLPGPAAVAPSAVLVACVAAIGLGWTRTWGWVLGVTAVASEMSAVASIIAFRATALHPHDQTQAVQQVAFSCSVVGEIALMVLIALLVRTAPSIKPATVAVVGVSAVMALWMLPFLQQVTTENVLFAVTTLLLRAAVAVGAGLHLRSVDALRVRAVADARRAQRLDLARDLHDFVAHDVSGIVAQAQAAQLVAGHDSSTALAALRRIEQAGLKALASMDNTVHMLHETDGAKDTTAPEPLPGLADLSKLADQFSATNPAHVALHISPTALDSTPREIATTAYRIVVETLTNIRRHAPTAATVDIVVTDDPDPDRPALRVTVTNDATAAHTRSIPRIHRRGGLGLLGLADRVQALGGNLRAGPYGKAGWQVSAVLPTAHRAEATS